MNKKAKKGKKGKSKKSKQSEDRVDVQTETPPKMKAKEYEAELRTLQGELVAMQEWVKASGAKVCVVFEGRDSAGKGGTIKAITEQREPAGVSRRRAARARPSARRRRCTCSGTCRTSLPVARS